MSNKYIVQHTGRPFGPCEKIHESNWSDYSKHASENAAWKAIAKYKAHLSAGSWDDHYRVIAPNGTKCNRDEWRNKRDDEEYEKWYKKQR